MTALKVDPCHREMKALMSTLNMARNTCIAVLGLAVVPSTQPEYRQLQDTVNEAWDAIFRAEAYLKGDEAGTLIHETPHPATIAEARR